MWNCWYCTIKNRYHLKRGGVLAIEVPSIWAPDFLAYLMTRIKWFVKPPSGMILSHVGYYTPKTLVALIDKCGFTKVCTITGRWRIKYSGLLGLVGATLEPALNAFRMGGILHLSRKD